MPHEKIMAKLKNTNRTALAAGWLLGIVIVAVLPAITLQIPYRTLTPLLIAIAALIAGGAGYSAFQGYRLGQPDENRITKVALAFFAGMFVSQGVFSPWGTDEYGDRVYFGETLAGFLSLALAVWAGMKLHKTIMSRYGYEHDGSRWWPRGYEQ